MFKKISIFIINYIFIAGILEAYKFIDIKNFPITITVIFIVSAMFMAIGNITLKNSSENYILYILELFVLISFQFNESSQITSLLLFLFFFSFYFISYRKIEEETFNKIVNLYINIMVILSIYGVYQFWGRNFGIPYFDLYFEGSMVKGFNWSTEIILGNKFFWRSNAIFREPSFFSQYLALALMLVYNDFKYKHNKRSLIKGIILVLGFISSFSGTGGIIIISIMLINIIKSNKRIRSIMIIIISIFMSTYIINNFEMFNNIKTYFIDRFSEIINNTGSGGIRYVGTFEVMINSWQDHLLLGTGIGTAGEVAQQFNVGKTSIIGNTFVRVGVELGIIGMVLWLIFILIFVAKNYNKNDYYNIFLYFLLIQIINSEAFLDPLYWGLLYFLNFDFIPKKHIVIEESDEIHGKK